MQSLSGLLSTNLKKCDSFPNDASHDVKKESYDDQASSLDQSENTLSNPLEASPLVGDDDDEVQIIEPKDDQYYEATNQLVVYDPEANSRNNIEPFSDSTYQYPPHVSTHPPEGQRQPRVLPSVGAFTVQCANCFKWRLIPTKEIYEQIREVILQEPFKCERAREWKPHISCEDPADISQDGSRLWAIDKPNIAKPPPGWERLLRIRGEGSTKFADVYYSTPTGKKLRSMVDVQKYLLEHPEFMGEVNMSQFSFQIPKPLQENYVRKRPSRADLPRALADLPRALPPTEVRPVSWAGPLDTPEIQYGGGSMSSPYVETPDLEATPPPAKKRQVRRHPSSEMYNSSPLHNQRGIKIEDPQASGNSAYDL